MGDMLTDQREVAFKIAGFVERMMKMTSGMVNANKIVLAGVRKTEEEMILMLEPIPGSLIAGRWTGGEIETGINQRK